MRRPLTVAVTVLFLSSCGVPAQDEPHAVELPRRPLAATTATTPRPGSFTEVLCLVKDERLVQVVRRIDAVPDLQQQTQQLLAGPTETERNSGMTSALSGQALRASYTSNPGEVTVDVTEPDDGAARSDETLGYGQIVCTLTSRTDVDAVLFTRDGNRLEVPRADGSLASGPLAGEDFATLVIPG